MIGSVSCAGNGNQATAESRLIAYRVIDAAIQTSASGVGGQIQMWYVDAVGAHKADDGEITEIQSLVGGWQDEEGKVLDRAFGSEPPAPALAPLIQTSAELGVTIKESWGLP